MPESRATNQHEYVAANRMAQTSNHIVKPVVATQPRKTFIEKIVTGINYTYKKTGIIKNIPNNSGFSTSAIPPKNKTPEQIAQKKDTHGWQVGLAIAFCILGVIGAIIVALLIASAPFFAGAALSVSQALSDALLPLLFLLASLLFSDMAMSDGYNKGLIACIILDSIFLLILVFSVFS